MMLRVAISLDCDRCRQSYYQAAVSSDTESFFWESYAEDLKSSASMHGWHTEGDEIVCADCVEQEEEEELNEKEQAALAV